MKIRIDVPVYNRKKITELTLIQLNKTKAPQDEIFIYNDGSTEYDNAWLSQWGKVINYTMPKQDRWRNIHKIRSLAYRDFVKDNHKDQFDFLYLTDNDAFHDTNWRETLIQISKHANTAVSGYISNFMYSNYEYYRAQINKEVYEAFPFVYPYRTVSATGGGISIFLTADQVKYIVQRMHAVDMEDMWDCLTWGYLQNRYSLPASSYLEHFGKGGLHHNDWDFEKAIKPTQYLQNVRQPIIDYLEDKITRDEVLQKI